MLDAKLSAMVAGSPDEVSEDDHMSDWGNDAAVYSSDSELSDWEEPRDTYAAYTDSQSHSQAVHQTAAGKMSLCKANIRTYACSNSRLSQTPTVNFCAYNHLFATFPITTMSCIPSSAQLLLCHRC